MLCCGKRKNYFACEVVMLDGTVVYFNKNENIKLTSKPLIIFNKICASINLIEKEYFGLKYLDTNCKQIWLNLAIRFNEDACFMKDASQGPCTLYFGVKYYAPDPCLLKEEVTRYQFFLQLKQDILNGKLSCSWKKLTELSALALQSELGDYSISDHKRGYVSEFRFVPHQDESFEHEVSRLHSLYSGLIPSTAEMQYLKKCKMFDLYGLDLNQVKDDQKIPHQIGVSPRGVEIFKNKRRITIFYWPQLKSINHREEILILKVQSKQRHQLVIHNFYLNSSYNCKILWRLIADCHSFYQFHSTKISTKDPQYESEREEPEVVRLCSRRYPPRAAKSPGTSAPEKQLLDGCWDQLEKTSMFQVSERGGKYMTPTSERRAHHRRLQTLSDNESRQRRRRSRTGRSSGEESDSPSKRKIRKNRQNGNRRRSHYFTDTEVFADDQYSQRRSRESPDARRRRIRRYSREDEEARKQLWDQIRKEAAVTSRPDDVIPYTEIRTTGNAFNVRKRRPHVSGDEMVDALPVVTKVSSNNQRMRKRRNPKMDWDTRTFSENYQNSNQQRRLKNKSKSGSLILTQI